MAKTPQNAPLTRSQLWATYAPNGEVSDLAENTFERPWIFSAGLIIGAWFAGILLTTASVLTLRQLMGVQNPMVFTLTGIIIAGLSLWQRRQAQSPFSQELLNALIISGAFLAIFSTDYESNDIYGFMKALTLSIVIYPLCHANSVRFILSITTLTLLALFLADQQPEIGRQLFAAPVFALGLALFICPPRGLDMRALSYACLFCTSGAEIISYMGTELIVTNNSLKVTALLGGATVIYFSRPLLSKTQWPILAILGVFIAFIMPAGALIGFVLLLLAWARGDAVLAAFGIIISLFFLTHFYTTMTFSLVFKSYILILVGTLLTTSWYLLRKLQARGTK